MDCAGYAIVILIILVLLWYYGYIALNERFVGVAAPTFASSLKDSYQQTQMNKKGYTTNDNYLTNIVNSY